MDLLATQSQTTGELCSHFNLSRFAIMQHLKVLENAGLIRAEKHGRYRYNHLNHEQLARLRQQTIAEAITPATNSDTADEHVHIKQTFLYQTTPTVVFTALTVQIGSWWKNEGASILLEPFLGGRLWKQFNTSGSGVLFGTIDILRQNELLGIMGTMGVDTAISILRFRLSAYKTEQTKLIIEHHFVGQVDTVTYHAFQSSWQELLGIYLPNFLQQ